MYFLVYNSTGFLVSSGLTDESGKTVTGLKSGESYWVWPQDCDKCHGGDHDVAFRYWDNDPTNTVNPRSVVAQDSGVNVGAYYEYVPGPSEA
jgi:hypothetical protein